MATKFSLVLLFYCCSAIKNVVCGSHCGISQLQCDCGRANEFTSKIIGGAVTSPYKYPWMVLVNTDSINGSCGGALITRQYVLTAAHCLTNAKNVSVQIAVHEYNRPGQLIAASVLKIHPGFRRDPRDPNTSKNDIALIKLQKGVAISGRVRTLCLPNDPRLEQPGTQAIVAGWGKTQPADGPGSSSRFLKEIKVEILNAKETIKIQGPNGHGACQGDSGSPLFTKNSDGRFHVVGVTSNGPMPCMGISYHSRVSLYYQWIVTNIMDSVPCETGRDQVDQNANNYM